MPKTVFAGKMKILNIFLNKFYGSNGHVHDGQDEDGSAPKINLRNHATGVYGKIGADINSAAGLALGSDGNSFNVLGTTTITSISSIGVGAVVTLTFAGVLQITNDGVSIVLPDSQNIKTKAGAVLQFEEYALGKWRLINQLRRSSNIVTAVQKAVVSTTSTSFSVVTGLTVTLQPECSQGKIMLLADLKAGGVINRSVGFRLTRDGAPIYVGNAAGARKQVSAEIPLRYTESMYNTQIMCVDTPGSLSSIIYNIEWSTSGGDLTYLNRSGLDLDQTYHERAASSLTVIEYF